MHNASKAERSTRAGAGTVAGTGGIATVIVWLLGEAGVSLSAEVGSMISALLSAVALFVWHTGVKNILQGVWTGQGRFVPSE